MKKSVNSKILPWFTLGAGIPGLALRIWLYTFRDENGLLPAMHTGDVLVCILTAVVLGILFLCVKGISPDGTFSARFPRSVSGGLGSIAAALGILLFAVAETVTVGDIISKICLYLGILACGGLLVSAVCRFRGKTPPFLAYVLVTLYLMLHGVSQCRAWGGEPQLTTYCFQLLASVFLILTAYHRTAASIDKCNYRWFIFTSQAALFFCLLSLNTENGLFYIAMAIWSLLDFCTLQEN